MSKSNTNASKKLKYLYNYTQYINLLKIAK